MPGIGFSKNMSYLLNRFDVASSWLVIARLSYLYYSKYGIDLFAIRDNIGLVLTTFIMLAFLGISEYDKYNPALKNIYIATHCIWHLGIFFVMDVYLTNMIY